jgi:hypothetical protein
MERQKPKLVRVRVQNPDGTSEMKTVNMANLKTSPTRRHESLPPELERRAKLLYERVGYLLYPKIEKWLDGFCFDQNPDTEIEKWERIATVVDQLWLDTPKVLKRLDKPTLTRLIIAVSSDMVDIPSQLKGVNDEQVELVRRMYAKAE